MEKENNLFKLGEIVENVLEEYEETRNDDNCLYLQIIKLYCVQRNIDIEGLSFEYFLLNQREMGFPSIESVGRCRRRIQETRADLCATESVRRKREAHKKRVLEYVSAWFSHGLVKKGVNNGTSIKNIA